MKVYEVLAKDLSCFGEIEEFEQEIIADYINCPSSEDCKYDGADC